MRHIIIVFLCFLLTNCSHPDSKQYERNKGHQSVNIYPGKSSEPISNGSRSNSINSTQSRNVLKMELENGVRYVWIEINGIKLRFIFDTGASSICISPAEATVLYRQGSLSKKDILNKEYFQDATGKISEGTKVNLREIKIGSMLLENVKATIIDNVNAPLLLGQSVLERFGSIEIDNENSEIIFK